jgi:putative MFS transporter
MTDIEPPARAGAAAAAGTVAGYAEGSIAARIDRLPIGPTQWKLVLLGQLLWGCVVGLDAVIGRLYPVVWEPKSFVTPVEYQLLLGFSNGLGPLIGNYGFGYLSDRYGRRKIMIAACLCAGLLYLPVAWVKSFPVLLLTVTVAALGVGAAVCLAPTYNTEVSPPKARSRLMLGGNILAWGILGIGGSLLALYTLPAHPAVFVCVLALIPIVIMVPVIIFFVPESPRWLEGHGRYAQADGIVTGWEKSARKRHPDLPDPDLSSHLVPITEKVPVLEVFNGVYLRRTIVLLAVWVLLYAGIDYGYGSYVAVYIIDQGWTAHQLFTISLIGAIGGMVVLLAGMAFGERVERKTLVFWSGVLMCVGAAIYYFWPHSYSALVIGAILLAGSVASFISNMYNYTATAYPTRLRTLGVGWTDGVGHAGAVAGPLIAGQFYGIIGVHNHWPWFMWFAMAGSFLPGLLILLGGIRQRGAVLEVVSR